MNTTLAKFLSLAVTAVIIGGLIFGVAYTMITAEANHYESEIEAEQADLPN